MIDYIKGTVAELSPAHVVLEANNIGYHLNITLPTYSDLNNKKEVKLYVYESIREDAHILFGFLTPDERHFFMLLISVSGIGANTARVIMSSIAPSDLQNAILTGNVNILKSIKGIGVKTAERLIVELKDKVAKCEVTSDKVKMADNKLIGEAVAALVMLGFSQIPVQKTVQKVVDANPDFKVEQIIKQSLKIL